MKVGILFNESAGGNSRYPQMAGTLVERLSGNELFTCQGGFGGAYLPSAKILSVPARDFAARIDNAVETLADSGIGILVSVGGDGFAAHCAEALLRRSIDLPILGVAGGTANVGPLLGFDRTELGFLDLEKCIERRIIGLECSDGNRILGFAFNDVAIGDTFLGTLEDRMANLSVDAFLSTGEKREKRPSRLITGPDFTVRKNGIPVPSALKTRALVVAAPLNGADFYRGKAAAGALCLAPWTSMNAVLAISERNWIDTRVDGEGFSATEHLLFTTGDVVEISGLAEAGRIVVDGNPFRGEFGRITLRSLADAARSIHPGAGSFAPGMRKT